MTYNMTLRRTVSLSILLLLLAALLGAPGHVPAAMGAEAQSRSYLVQGPDLDQVIHLVELYGGRVTSHLEIVNGVGALLTPQAAALLEKEAGISAVTVNATVQATAKKRGKSIPETDYVDVVGADLTWPSGPTGSGITVAVVDTGLSPLPGLTQGLERKMRDRIVGWKDFVDGKHKPVDPNGHGTHVAGIILNTDIGEDGEWNGMAPGAYLVGVRVLNEQGFGTYEQVIQGIQWVIQHKDRHNIRVMNLSLVSPVLSPYWADPLNQAVTRAWAEGITVVVAAGNGGPNPMSIGVPGNNPYVITVGAFTDGYTALDFSDDYLAPFSASGPTLDAFVKPDLLAPGAHMVSMMHPSSYIAHNHQANQISPHYFSMAGTSQSAAVVSGAAALVLSQHPELTPNQVKYRLMYTALPWINLETTEAVYSMWQQGAGRLNTPDAALGEMEGEANQGMDIWADLAGTTHYEGYTYYDETTGAFRLRGDFGSWSGGFGSWSGGYGPWTGGFGSWSGGFGSWSGGFGSWSGGFGSWSGGFGSWSGGFGSWSGGFGSWSGGFGSWSGGFGSWSGSEPWSGTIFADPSFYQGFLNGQGPNASNTTIAIDVWVDEPQP
jgi:serine protease AprX